MLGVCAANPELCAAIGLMLAAEYMVAYPISRPAQPLTLAPVLLNGGAIDSPRVPIQTAQGVRHATAECDTEDKRQQFMKNKNDACAKPRGCQKLEATEANRKIIDEYLGNGLDCLFAREQIQLYCFAPGDPGFEQHDIPLNDDMGNVFACWKKKFAIGR